MIERGREGEQIAADYLIKENCRILEKNFRCRFGEIDIIAKEGQTLVVVEVKYRQDKHKGSPAEAVDWRKQRKICRTFDYYRMLHRLDEYTPVRFDVMEVYPPRNCHWIKNAFEYTE